MTNPRDARRTFDQAVDHIQAAYRFFVACLPRQERFTQGRPVRIGRFEFQELSQAESMEVELGWAFFTRLEGAYEALTLRLGLTPKTAGDKLRDSGKFTEAELEGLVVARELRNILHHGDGDASLLKNQPTKVAQEQGREPQLRQEHMDQFVKLFKKAADVLTQPSLRVV